MNEIVLQVLFWGAFTLLVYSYLIYPAALMVAARRRHGPAGGQEAALAALPSVAVIVAAFNEEGHIAARIGNLQGQDFPAEKLLILIGSDGSTDRTVERAMRFAGPRVEVQAYAVNRGKASVLNDLVAKTDAEVLVFTDANTHFAPGTVRQLATSVGEGAAAVCGELILEKAGTGGNEDHRYWSMECRLKRAESSLGALVGANGGVYAIRRECFRPLPPDTICDDFVIAMNIANAGLGLRYVPEAVAYEQSPPEVTDEFHRRVRIGIGNYQAFFRNPEYLFSGPWLLRITYASHKVLRWFTPHLLLMIAICSVLLSSIPLYRLLAILLGAGLLSAVVLFALRSRVPLPATARAALLFAVLNAAFMVAFVRFLAGNYRGSWRRTDRSSPPHSSSNPDA